MTTSITLPLRADSLLAQNLRAQGLVARIVIEREDGAELTPDQAAHAPAAVRTFEQVEREAQALWIAREAETEADEG